MSGGKGEHKVSPSRLRFVLDMIQCDDTNSSSSNVKQQQIKEKGSRNSTKLHCKHVAKLKTVFNDLTDDSNDSTLDFKPSAIESKNVTSMHASSQKPSSDCKASAKHDCIRANGQVKFCDADDDDSLGLGDPDMDSKPSAEEWNQVMSVLDQDNVARKKASTDLLHMHQQIKLKREHEDYLLCKSLQEKESHKTADPIQEQKEMIKSTSGKAVVLVQRIIQLVNDAKKEFPLSVHQFDSVATDDMVYMAERILDKQQEFLKKGVSSYIDVGYHYTHPDNMHKIRSNGLLSKAERKTKRINSRHHGSIFGDGIYTANYPTSFAIYGEQGLIVARLIGKSVRVPKSISCLTSSKYLDIANSSDTIVGDKAPAFSSGWPSTDVRHEIVLKSSTQCLPMIRYDRRLVGKGELRTDHQGLKTYVFTSNNPNRIVESFKCKLQKVLDDLINERSQPEPYGQLLENNSYTGSSYGGSSNIQRISSSSISNAWHSFGPASLGRGSTYQPLGRGLTTSSHLSTINQNLANRPRGILKKGSWSTQHTLVSSFSLGCSNQWNSLSNTPSTNVTFHGKGTTIAPFLPTRLCDGHNRVIQFQSITAMQQYSSKSFEELRFEDYMKGNKGSQGQTPTVGTSIPPSGGTRLSAHVSIVSGASGAHMPAGCLMRNSLPSGVSSSGGTLSTQQKPMTSGGIFFRGSSSRQQKSYASAVSNTTYGRSLGTSNSTSSAFGITRSTVHYGGFSYVPINNSPSMQSQFLHYDAPNDFAEVIPQNTFTKPTLAKDDDCIICYEKLSDSTIVALNVCDHVFHRDCIQHALKVMKPQCPVCRKTVGVVQGKSPSGTMEVTLSSIRCSGFMDSSIIIHYVIGDGIQKKYHDNPGQLHSGKCATAYLPNNTEGRDLLKRLKYAFLHGLIFTVGTSATTGGHNQCTWSTIHHKTSPSGGAQSHGFPDPYYFINCNEELDTVKVPKSYSLDDNGVET